MQLTNHITITNTCHEHYSTGEESVSLTSSILRMLAFDILTWSNARLGPILPYMNIMKVI